MPNNTDEWSQYEVKPTPQPTVDEFSQYEVKKKEEPVSFGGSESLASPSAPTVDKQPLTYMQQQLREKGLIVDAPTTKELNAPQSGSETLKALKSSSARALGGIIGLPNFIEDQIGAFVLKPIMKGFGFSEEEAQGSVDRMKQAPMMGSVLTGALSEAAQQQTNKYASSVESTMKQYDEGILGSIYNKDFGDAGAQIWKGAVQSLPYLVMTAATSGGGAPAVLGTIGTTAAAQRYGELVDPASKEGKTLSETGKIANSWAYGGFEAAGELVTAGLANVVKKAVSQIGKEAAEQIGKGFVKEAAKDFLLEGSSEAMTELGQQTTDYIQGLRDNIDFKAIGDVALIGGVTGVGFAGATTAANKTAKMLAGRKIASDEDVTKVNENNAKIVDLLSEKQKAETPEADNIIDAELANVAKENKDIIDSNEKKAERLNPEEIIKLKDLDDAIDSYDVRIESPSETDNPELLKQIKEKLVSDKETLIKEATSRKAAPEIPTKQEPVVVEEPTAEQKLKDVKEGNVVSFVYEKESDVPEILKDKISSSGEVNGVKQIKVTLAKSEADYLLQNNEIKPTEPISETIEPQLTKEAPIVPSEEIDDLKQQKEKELAAIEIPSTDIETLNISDKAKDVLGRSIDEYNNATPEQKIEMVKTVSDQIELNKKGEENIGFSLDKDMVEAGTEFLNIIEQQKQPTIVGEQIEVKQLKLEENGKESSKSGDEAQRRQEETLLKESKVKLEREVKKEENKARLGRIFDNAAKLTGARLDITSEEKRIIRKELARDVVDYVKTEFDLLGEALVEKVKSFVKDNNIPLEDISDQELNDVLKEQDAKAVREQDKGDVGTQKGVVEGTEGKIPVGNDVKDQEAARGEGETVKDSQLGIRWAWGKSIAPEAQERYKAEGLYSYKPESHDDVELVARSIVDNNPVEKSLKILTDKEITRRVRTAVGVLLIDHFNEESTKLYEFGNTNKANDMVDTIVEIMETVQKEIATESGRDISFMGSNFMVQRLGGYQLARIAQKGMAASRTKTTASKSYKRIQKLAQDELGKARKEAIDEVVKKVVEPKKQKQVDPKITEVRKKRESLIDQWKKAKQSKENAYSTIVPGLTNVDIDYGGRIALTYIEEGIYRTEDLVKKLKNVFKRVGMDIDDNQAKLLLPVKYNNQPLEDYQNEQDLQKAAESLAQRIFGDVIDKKTKPEDPLRKMVDTLFSKFKDTQLVRNKGEKPSDLDKLTMAIRDKDAYKEAWSSAKDSAINKVNEDKKLSEDQKAEYVDRIQKAYDNATEFTFSEKLIKDIVRKELSEKNIDIADIVRDHFERRDVVKEDLKRTLIEKAGLSESEAKTLSDAINSTFDTLIADKATQIIKKYVEKGKTKPTRSQTKGADEIIQLSNAGAFTNEAFLNAFADAWGIPKLDKQDTDYIVSQSKKIQKIKGEAMKYEEKQKLLSYIANIKGIDWGEFLDGIWYANVLSGAGTQLKNALDANTAALVEPLLIAGSSQFKRTRLRRAIARTGGGRALTNFKHTFKTGKHPFDLGTDAPKLAERISTSKDPMVHNKAAWGAIKAIAKVQNAVFDLMMSNDAFAGTLAYESIIDALITDSAYSEAKTANNGNLTSEQRKALNAKIDEMLRIRPEDQKIINDILDQESEEYKQVQATDGVKQTGYSKEQRDIRFFEIMDSLRPIKFVEDARRISLEAVGNINPYGTLGFIINAVSGTLNKIGYDFYKPIAIKDGKGFKIAYSPTEKIRIRPFQKIIPFTRIITNLATRNLNWNLYVAPVRLATGKYGSALSSFEKSSASKYVREMSPSEKKILKRKILVTAAIASIAYALTGGDDPENGLIRITGNGTGDWDKNKQLTAGGWKPWSIQIGDFSISYQYIYPLNMILSAVGWARDQQIYNKSELPFIALFAEGLFISIGQVLFSTPMSGISTAFDLMGSLVYKGVDKFATGLSKLTTNIGGGFVSPRFLDDIDKTFGVLSNRSDIEGVTVFEKFADKIPFVGRNFAGKVVAIDILGDKVPLPSPTSAVISGLIDFSNRDDYKNKEMIKWITEKANYFRPIPEYGQTTFKVLEKDGAVNVSRKLVAGNDSDEAFWTEYNITVSQLFKEEALKIRDKGLTNEESKEELSKAWQRSNDKAKREMFNVSKDRPLNTTQLK